MGRSAYNLLCPVCDYGESRNRHLNINLKRNVFRCPKCGQFEGGVLDLYAYYAGVPRNKVRQELTERLEGGELRCAARPKGRRRERIGPKPPEAPQAPLVDVETRDRVYRAFLNKLTLAPDHRDNLLGRGLTGGEIQRLGYRTTPSADLRTLAEDLIAEGHEIFGVPGFFRDGSGRWTGAIYSHVPMAAGV